jgi:hypothetical protein
VAASFEHAVTFYVSWKARKSLDHPGDYQLSKKGFAPWRWCCDESKRLPLHLKHELASKWCWGGFFGDSRVSLNALSLFTNDVTAFTLGPLRQHLLAHRITKWGRDVLMDSYITTLSFQPRFIKYRRKGSFKSFQPTPRQLPTLTQITFYDDRPFKRYDFCTF